MCGSAQEQSTTFSLKARDIRHTPDVRIYTRNTLDTTLSSPETHLIMVGGDLRGLLQVDALPPSDKIYQGVQDGGLLLRSSLVYHQSPSVYTLTERHLVALALTEVCCDIGKGKVKDERTYSVDHFGRLTRWIRSTIFQCRHNESWILGQASAIG